jgi:hypothetical protein
MLESLARIDNAFLGLSFILLRKHRARPAGDFTAIGDWPAVMPARIPKVGAGFFIPMPMRRYC